MNKLWIRLSLAFCGVIIFSVLLPVGMVILFNQLGLVDLGREPSQFPEADLVQALRAILRFMAIAALIGIVAGVWMSRQLTRPLGELADAAAAIEQRDLSSRVAVKGTDEITAVADAFNDMAAGLETAEQQRRNLLADVAHELRTPLSVLQGNLQAILDDVYVLDKEEVARLYDQTRHLNRLVNDLHDLAQAEARQLPLTMQRVDVANLVRNVLAHFIPLAEAQDITLQSNLPDQPLPLLQADPARITQALQNLLINALRYTPAGGTIIVNVQQDANELQIEVKDSGSGVALEHQPFVFDRFYRTDKARSRDAGGTGLGLAITKAIIEAHDGRVSIQSGGPGQGSNFTITLPL